MSTASCTWPDEAMPNAAITPHHHCLLTATTLVPCSRPNLSGQPQPTPLLLTDTRHTLAIMDEIAPEYDVVVLGTGGCYPAAPASRQKLTVPRSHRMRSFRVTRPRRGGYAETDGESVFLVSRARRSCTSTATTTMAGRRYPTLLSRDNANRVQ